MEALKTQLEENKQKYLDELFELLRIPSVSTDPSFSDDVFEAAEFVKKKLAAAGADEVELVATKGYPIVYGEKIIDPNLPTILVYGHYDVQPADPYDLWETPPFEPEIRNDSIYARGSCDDKGQMYMHIKAFEMMMEHDTLACNVKFMIEGEEEVGSKHLSKVVEENKDKLKADVVLISDTSMVSIETPSITAGLRGLSFLEVEVTGPNKDLHSGVYGGAVANPLNVLCEMIAKLKDDDNKVAIPGFYDDVEDVSQAERDEMASVAMDDEVYKRSLNVKELRGEAGYSTIERTAIRPTLDVNGMWGGYIKEGAKTVIGAKATAKISMRLVPHQDSTKIGALFTKYFKSLAPDSVTVKVSTFHGGEPYVTPIDSTAYKAASMAIEKTFGKRPVGIRSGGSIPITALFERVLGVKSILLGFGLDSDDIHSPNEHFGLFNFYKGIETIPYFFKYFAEITQKNN